MADFFSNAGLEEIIKSGEAGVNNLMLAAHSLDTDMLVQKTIDDLDAKIKFLKEQEQKFLDVFDCADTNEFKNRVAKYYNDYGALHFTGNNLRRIVDSFESLTKIDLVERQALIERIVYNILNDPKYNEGLDVKFLEAFKNNQVTNEIAATMAAKVAQALSGMGLGEGGTLQATTFGQSSKTADGKQIFEIVAKLTTDAFNDHLADLRKIFETGKINKDILANLQKDPQYQALSKEEKIAFKQELVEKAQILLKPLPTKTQIGNMQMKQTFMYDWVTLIKGATKGKTGKGSDINVSDKELHKINTKIQKILVDEFMANVPNNTGEIRKFLNDRISTMWQKDPKMFFIGKASTELEGLVGEINAVVSLTALLGPKYASRAIQWIGSQMGSSKKKPSIDIAIREIGGMTFGVQIKNTMDNLDDGFLHSISFANSSVNNIFNKLGINDQSIQDVLFADTFNVPYEYNLVTEQFVPMYSWKERLYDSETFLDIEKQIDILSTDINNYLRLYASDFLYIGLGNDFRSKLAVLDMEILNNAGGNYVYIVGPKVFFASEMLDKLYKDMQALQKLEIEAEQLSFQIEVYFDKKKGDSGNYDIISVLNSKKGSKSKLRTLKMRSSWTFSE